MEKNQNVPKPENSKYAIDKEEKSAASTSTSLFVVVAAKDKYWACRTQVRGEGDKRERRGEGREKEDREHETFKDDENLPIIFHPWCGGVVLVRWVS